MLFGKKFFKKKNNKQLQTQNTQNYSHIYVTSKHFFNKKSKKHPQKSFIERFLYFPARLAAFLK